MKLTKKNLVKFFSNKYLLSLIAILLIFLYCIQEKEHFNDSYRFVLPFSKDEENGDSNGFSKSSDDFVLDFSKIEDLDTSNLDTHFTSISYSGLKTKKEDDEKESDEELYSFGDKLEHQIWSGTEAEYDPTGGNVKYMEVNLKDGLYKNNNQELIKLDKENKFLKLKLGEPEEDSKISKFIGQKESNKNIYPSVRLTSKKSFKNDKQHLFILKAKLPYGKGLWPAWWLAGTDGNQNSLNTKWPTNGEIDIIELINEDSTFKNVLHMCKNCKSRWKKGPKMGKKDDEWGRTTQCQGVWNNSGCFIGDVYDETDTEMVMGTGNLFTDLTKIDDSQRGGIFACYWNPKQETDVKIKKGDNEETVTILGNIKFYYWDYNEKSNINDNNGPLTDNPDPSKWDKEHLLSEVEYWKGEGEEENQKACSLAAADNGVDCQFNNIKMVFNTTLCGDWAGHAYEGGMEECRNYLINNSDKITDKEWDISYIAAFSKDL